ncbi:MAG: LapA family protein [Lactobacillus sp.]|jgi:uncharacterized integral membrane protein|nr:LapA family protein [Lactobacillus sp.]MCH3906423.1 LapA family protein [Lactobacillus sp.]MCH3990002.1 LapA family protein [Lactobacillus sp.]MCH4069284.1 LapA family protein [Lactobacillus sp.]MCI1303586.1 LapA family protein [Lactobacillus sp.]
MATKDKPQQTKSSRKQDRLISAIVIVLLLVIFAVLNVKPVTINFGFFAFKQPLIIVLIIMFLLGALVSWLVGRKE